MSNNKSNKNVKVYAKTSTIPEIGLGLFAKKLIKTGSIISEYRGQLRNTFTDIENNRSVIYFNDDTFLECFDNDLASYANDAINFTGKRRKIMDDLRSNHPFYAKHENATVNSTIKVNTKLHRAWLLALNDIQPDQEIFCHYGFSYWFGTEISKLGFSQEQEIDEKGFPDKIFQFPAFVAYLNEFYPDHTNCLVKPYYDDHELVIEFGSDGKKCDNYIVMILKNYSKLIEKIECVE
ncbi:SET domain protein [Cotonvirus japonicus]|uniref:SET domain protein n=1 Tax=Cotonvirus japonicus TaxID=2811091 RepID=A0ABM7NRK6_9VIRU|nr:SET domain protein [Cotonvirus japonicus]BCS82791.1 SET domain protein [Cotonvirus japonicus]